MEEIESTQPTHQPTFHTETPPQTTNHTPCHRSWVVPGIAVPLGRCNPGSLQQCQILPFHCSAKHPQGNKALYLTFERMLVSIFRNLIHMCLVVLDPFPEYVFEREEVKQLT